jgi:hypothetical protein
MGVSPEFAERRPRRIRGGQALNARRTPIEAADQDFDGDQL